MSRDPMTMMASARPRCRLECALEIAGLPHLERLKLHLQRARGALGLAKLGIGVIRIPQNGDARHPRRRVFEQLDRLSGQQVVDEREAGEVSSRPREARNQAAFDRIIAHDHDDRNSRGRLLDRRG